MPQKEENFYKKFKHYKPKKINSIANKGVHYQDQPDFIKFYDVDGVELAFLGGADFDMLKKSKDKMYKIFDLFIPKGARLIKPDKLLAYIKNDRNTKKIDVENPLHPIFYEHKIADNIVLNICGDICNYADPNNSEDHVEPIHFCDKFKNLSELYFSLFGICDQALLSLSSFETAETSTFIDRPKYEPIIFYLDEKSIDSSSQVYKRLYSYFRRPRAGFFMIPVQDPNKGASYILIPNADDYLLSAPYLKYPEGGNGVKNILFYWIDLLTKFDSNEQIAMVAINDTTFLPIDSWHSCVYQKFQLLFKPRIVTNKT